MSDLDRELAEAVEATEASDAANGGVVRSSLEQAPAPASPKRRFGLLAALLVIGGGILALMLTSAEDASIYAIQVDQLVAQKDKFADRTVRAQGFLVKGSLLKRDDPCEFRFKIHNSVDKKSDAVLAVRYPNCVVPDTFRDVPNIDVEVTAEGKLAANGEYLEATHIMAKCPSKYEMQQKQLAGEKAPHTIGQTPEESPAGAAAPYGGK